MHNPDYAPNSTFSLNEKIAPQIHFRFAPTQDSLLYTEKKLSDLISNKVRQKEFFYGVEISAHNFAKKNRVLDYNIFGSFLPLFTSLIWFGADYAQVETMSDVESIRSARHLETKTTVLPHFTAYKVDENRLKNFLDLNFRNILVLRGDQFDPNQEYQHASDMIAKIRELKGDTISIGVGGYPEGHSDSKNLDQDIEFLSQKVRSGADFIITQVCFSSEAIISFVRRCRDRGIQIPIMVGILVPDSESSLKRMMSITGARLSTDQMESFQMYGNDPQKFRKFAINSTVNMISEVMRSNLDIYGFHFFTLNRFKNVERVLQQLFDSMKLNEIKR